MTCVTILVTARSKQRKPCAALLCAWEKQGRLWAPGSFPCPDLCSLCGALLSGRPPGLPPECPHVCPQRVAGFGFWPRVLQSSRLVLFLGQAEEGVPPGTVESFFTDGSISSLEVCLSTKSFSILRAPLFGRDRLWSLAHLVQCPT